MVKKILKYPDIRLFQISGYIREFNDELKKIATDLIDTAKKNNLTVLTALQIGINKKIIAFKIDDEYKILINATVFNQQGFQESEEECISFDNLKVKTKRYDKIKIMYQNLEGNDKYLNLEGKDSIDLQRAINLTFGELLIDRADKNLKKSYHKDNQIEAIDVCPTFSLRDYILSGVKFTVILELIILILQFFSDFFANIYSYTPQITIFGFGVLSVYFIYARIETAKYKNCTSCQNANSVGNFIGYGGMLLGFYMLYLLIEKTFN